MKILKKTLKIFLIVVLSIVLLATAAIFAARLINGGRYKAALQKSEFITLGGIPQYIQTRGEDPANPVIIMLHGGPGSPMGFYSYYWQAPLEQDYTILHWDQRGSGNTFYRGGGLRAEKPTLDRLLSDLDELVDYARTEYGQEKVVILGHSWGTLLGGLYAAEHPDKVSGYIGVGQMADSWGGEEAVMREAMAQAPPEEAAAIEAQFQTMRDARPFDLEALDALLQTRALTAPYLPKAQGMSFLEQIGMGLFSPNATLDDLRWYLFPAPEHNTLLFDALFPADASFVMADRASTFQMPVTIIMGELDRVTPYAQAQMYYDGIAAPNKMFLTVEGAGHTPFLDQPEAFMLCLREALQRI